ncbi:succinate dehydrogenase subunit C [Nitrosomonas sp. PY1]|uniref:succinate dehydrogenase, cytochrome b556 subunit n=1 Tax=Nitrosomonas sp. PY1 TaxID=1803906 RepID=UPI001FC801AD|nr:succinate dehydrogenase, cytochrome b556 subunit [Nitrosomonas sp. PY1]GKS68031.1 succinate dehydrogenase subunit C [Nitrosomonas sp. PY1]
MIAKTYSNRPKYLNLLKIKQPLPAIVSIIHRITGVLLFFPGIPVLLCIFQDFLGSQESFDYLQKNLQNPLMMLIILPPLWFFFHHVCAGIRHLLLDQHIGVELQQARTSAYLVFVVGIMLTTLTGLLLW